MAEAHPGKDAAAHLLRDFVNTLDVETGADELTAPAAVAEWLAGRGLVPAAGPAHETDLATAIALREGLRAAMRAHHGPLSSATGRDEAREEALADDLEDALAALPLRITLAGPRPALVPADAPDTAVRAGLAHIAAAVMDAAADGTWTRLKVCLEDTCRWAFLDTSKNRSRSWCSMRVCGNRTKTRAYRARRRTPPGRPAAG
ncbi:CGNR zinc finger domain-containing protein [Actinomadura roseirufa]|uniref:CGNR zinc finger domain-containing protein n=1 Tax=Actinomadura roseirufa TaxID=2094049 RepID=UPI001041B9B3|nr:CGNR zinc finger domain-containing protein [Actinomadura roseirufa]